MTEQSLRGTAVSKKRKASGSKEFLGIFWSVVVVVYEKFPKKSLHPDEARLYNNERGAILPQDPRWPTQVGCKELFNIDDNSAELTT
eukprot:5230546-Lingulodinium_polyedra.AAC.1